MKENGQKPEEPKDPQARDWPTAAQFRAALKEGARLRAERKTQRRRRGNPFLPPIRINC